MLSNDFLCQILDEDRTCVNGGICDILAVDYFSDKITWTGLDRNEKEHYGELKINDLAIDLKAWAKDKGYFVNSGFDVTGKAFAEVKYNLHRGFTNNRTFHARNDAESAIVACQRVFEHIKEGGFF